MGKLSNGIKDREFIKDNLPKNKNGNIIWRDAIGKTFSIKYDGVVYNFVITKYDSTNRHLYFIYNENEYHMHTSGLLKCNIGLIVGLLTTDFKYQIGDIVNGYKILSQERTKKKNGKTYRSYNVECTMDGYKNNVSETGLERGDGCPVCDNKVIIRGVNDMWTTNQELASLLANPDDGYKYTQYSQKNVDWKCPYCNSLVKK